jgi:hypothetical protein
VIAAFVMGAMVATQGAAFADKPDGPVIGPGPFLCPVVGNETAAANNGQEWFGVNAGLSFFPGNNQAGLHANYKAFNKLNPPFSPGPGGGNSDWSPIWPGDFVFPG